MYGQLDLNMCHKSRQFDMYYVSMVLYHIYGSNAVIQNDRLDFTIPRISCVKTILALYVPQLVKHVYVSCRWNKNLGVPSEYLWMTRMGKHNPQHVYV